MNDRQVGDQTGTMRVVLLGDSHLARVRRNLGQITDSEIVNLAVGGSLASDLVPQATAAALTAADRVVVSVGTNDAAPWRQSGLAEALEHVDAFLASFAPVVGQLVHLASPGVDESRLLGSNNRTNVEMARYSSAFARAFEAVGARVVDAAEVLAPLGAAAFVADGVHLSGDGYDVLLPALRTALGG